MNKDKSFFGIDGAFMRFGTWLWDCILISLLWIFFSGAVVMVAAGVLYAVDAVSETAYYWINGIGLAVTLVLSGPASTAAFYSFNRKQREADTYRFRDFWESYKENFGKGAAMSAILGGALTLLGWLIFIEAVSLTLMGMKIYILIGVQLMLVLILLFMVFYAFPLLARFELKVKDYLRLSFIMGIKHLPQTLLVVLSLVGALALVIVVYWMFALFAIGLFFWLQSLILEKVLRKYIDEDDETVPDDDLGYDIEAEQAAIAAKYAAITHYQLPAEAEDASMDETAEAEAEAAETAKTEE